MDVSHRDTAWDWIAEAIALSIVVVLLTYFLSIGGLGSGDLLIIGIAWLAVSLILVVRLFEKVDSMIKTRLAIHAKASERGRE